LSFKTQANLHFSKTGEILESDIYWAIQARYDLDNIKETIKTVNLKTRKIGLAHHQYCLLILSSQPTFL